MQEAAFLQAIRQNPTDTSTHLVYADWLEERGDVRAEFLRLHAILSSVAPDHLGRMEAEGELSRLRKAGDHEWLDIVEPEHRLPEEDRWNCRCIEHWHAEDEVNPLSFSESTFHCEAQDTDCDEWKRLLSQIEEAAATGQTEFAPLRGLGIPERAKILTLPPTIAKLKKVRELHLYGSWLVRLPPEIGEMESLVTFDPYTSYRLHWFPYEIVRCKSLNSSCVSTRALYGNYKLRPPFPRLLPLESGPLMGASAMRKCSVCEQPFEDRGLHRVWISLPVATDVLPLLVNACSRECIDRLPTPPENYAQTPHQGGLAVVQPETEF